MLDKGSLSIRAQGDCLPFEESHYASRRLHPPSLLTYVLIYSLNNLDRGALHWRVEGEVSETTI